MSDHGGILAAAREWRGGRMALATVVSTWGSAPRPRGSHMLVHEDGRFEGSVSGGCVEGDVLATAAEVIESGDFALKHYGVADAAAWEVGLPCGGEILVAVQSVGEGGFPPEFFDEIAACAAKGEAIHITTDLLEGYSRIGQFVRADNFINRYLPPRRLFVIGAVQIAQSLCEIARAMGTQVTVIDPRGRFLTEERFPGVTLDDRWPDEALVDLKPDAASAVVTLSHDPKIDDPALIAALRAPTGYVAALGSRKSHAARLERLAASGFDGDALARIEGPAGLAIGAIGPSEIALSIAAGMVKALNEPADHPG